MIHLLSFIVQTTSTLGAGTAADDWDWSYTHSWSLVNTNGRMGAAGLLTDYEAKFLATHNDIVGVGGTFGEAAGGVPVVYAHGEAAQAAAAKQLKSYNPNVKVIIYRNSGINIDGQLQACKEFDNHPEWLLRNSTGSPVGTQLWYDFTFEGMRNWWINSTIDALTDFYSVNGTYIDGVYIDGASDEVASAFGLKGITTAKAVALNASHYAAIKELTRRVKALRPGMFTIGNGAVVSQCLRHADGTMPWGQDCTYNLDALDGVCAEHFGSFNAVNATSGNFNQLVTNGHGAIVMERWEDALDLVGNYSKNDGLAVPKAILVKSWPGPFNIYYSSDGKMEFTWKNFSDANITLTNLEKKEHGAAAFAWSHAAYLLTVAPGSYISYNWWYQVRDGYVPCPEAPTTCSCPDDWYPALSKPTGKPLGSRTRVSGGTGHRWNREFEQVSVTVDLGNFTDVSIVWKPTRQAKSGAKKQIQPLNS